MEKHEVIRQTYRPHWSSIFLGVTCTFAAMGIFVLIGIGCRLILSYSHHSLTYTLIQIFFGLISLSTAAYLGGFISGFLMPDYNPTAAVVDGLLVWEITILIFAVTGWFGYEPLPGLSFAQDIESSSGLLWMAMMLALPAFFLAAFGAAAGNRWH